MKFYFFRVSADQDVLTSVRFQLEKLFEVFRVLEITSRDSGSTFSIVRPPPRGWSHSQQVFASESPSSTTEAESEGATRSPLLQCLALTGPFGLPLKPSPIPAHPAEYMLLTPRALWPGDLAGFDEVAATGTNEKGAFLDPHLAAALLKLWLREMATPLIPPALTPEVFAYALEAEAFEKSAGATNAVGAEPIEKCCALVRRLPTINRRVLLYLIKLCQVGFTFKIPSFFPSHFIIFFGFFAAFGATGERQRFTNGRAQLGHSDSTQLVSLGFE